MSLIGCNLAGESGPGNSYAADFRRTYLVAKKVGMLYYGGILTKPEAGHMGRPLPAEVRMTIQAAAKTMSSSELAAAFGISERTACKYRYEAKHDKVRPILVCSRGPECANITVHGNEHPTTLRSVNGDATVCCYCRPRQRLTPHLHTSFREDSASLSGKCLVLVIKNEVLLQLLRATL